MSDEFNFELNLQFSLRYVLGDFTFICDFKKHLSFGFVFKKGSEIKPKSIQSIDGGIESTYVVRRVDCESCLGYKQNVYTSIEIIIWGIYIYYYRTWIGGHNLLG